MKNKINTNEDFIKKVFELVGNEYTFLDEYINTKTHLNVIHNKCGFKYKVTPSNFLYGYRCPNCKKSKIKNKLSLNTKTFKERVFNLVGNEYSVLGEYVNNHTKIKMKHNICGYEYDVTPEMFIGKKQRRCPNCKKDKLRKNFSYNNEDFIKNVIKNEKYILLDNYINSNTKITLKHLDCNSIFKIRPNDFQQGQRCPNCYKLSYKGEEKIKKYLMQNNIEFEQQFSFEDCKNIKPLKFDFRIICENPNDYILIEYDGKQHEKISFNESINEFNNQLLRDSIKNKYCKSHDNIDLYRISYKDFDNIENILDNILNKYK